MYKMRFASIPGSDIIRSNSKVFSQVFLWSIIFLMLPIDSLLNVNIQGQIASPIVQLLSNDIAKILLAVLFYMIACCNDTVLLVLYVCLLKKLGLF